MININTNGGTSNFGHKVVASANEIHQALGGKGKPERLDEDKSQFEFSSTINLDRPIQFFIYDWKEERKLKKSSIAAFHIGVETKEDGDIVLNMLKDKLTALREKKSLEEVINQKNIAKAREELKESPTIAKECPSFDAQKESPTNSEESDVNAFKVTITDKFNKFTKLLIGDYPAYSEAQVMGISPVTMAILISDKYGYISDELKDYLKELRVTHSETYVTNLVCEMIFIRAINKTRITNEEK